MRRQGFARSHQIAVGPGNDRVPAHRCVAAQLTLFWPAGATYEQQLEAIENVYDQAVAEIQRLRERSEG